MAIVIGIVYPRAVFFIATEFPRAKWLALAFSVAVTASVAYEIHLIRSVGIIAAYDASPRFLDVLNTLNCLAAPAALTHLVLFALDKCFASKNIVKNVTSVICCLSIWASLAALLIYDSAAHYRTDSEGTYRIDER